MAFPGEGLTAGTNSAARRKSSLGSEAIRNQSNSRFCGERRGRLKLSGP